MQSDTDKTKAKTLQAAGIEPEQVELAMDTSAGLRDHLGKAKAGQDDLGIREVFAAFAASAASGKSPSR